MVLDNNMVEVRIVRTNSRLIIRITGIMWPMRYILDISFSQSVILIPFADGSSILFQFISGLINRIHDPVNTLLTIDIIIAIFWKAGKCTVAFTVAI